MERSDWQILDVNINRLVEALRVLEDICRFKYRLVQAARGLKLLRHEVTSWRSKFSDQLLRSRRSETDLGRKDYDLPYGVANLWETNFNRAKESVRVIEELTRVLIPEDVSLVRGWRFKLYDLEKEYLKKEFDLSFYAIVGEELFNLDIKHVVDVFANGGVTAIQLRVKQLSDRKFWQLADELHKLTGEYNIPLIINDRVDIAVAVDAEGIHLGQDDMPADIARKLLGYGKLLGVTVHSVEEAKLAEEMGADYLGVSSPFVSKTKDKIILKPSEIREIKQNVDIPVIVVGGINLDNVEQVLSIGIDGVAVHQALFEPPDIEQNVRRLGAKISKLRETG